MATYLVVTPISHGNGPKDTSLQRKPSFSLLETTEDMDISKMMLTPIHSMPHTATTVMVRHSVWDMTFTLQAIDFTQGPRFLTVKEE